MAQFSLKGMYDWAIAWCNAPNVGYDQSYRNMQVKNGYITCFDCSSFTFFAIWLGGGFNVGELGFPTDLAKYRAGEYGYNAWNVTGMRRCLPYIGFTKITPYPSVWLPGDILVEIGEHTEICYESPRRVMGAHNRHLALPDQVSIRSGNADVTEFNELWRYTNGQSPVDPPPQPDPDNPGDPGTAPALKNMPLWMMTKPWWKI